MFEQFTEMDIKNIKDKEQKSKNNRNSNKDAAILDQMDIDEHNNRIEINLDEDTPIKAKHVLLPELQPFEKDVHTTEDLKKIIYKTYAKSTDKSKENKKKERKKLKNIMNLLIYLQIKKVEMKLQYFNEFEKMVQYEKQQIKTLESQLIGDKIHLALKKSELGGYVNKLKDSMKNASEFIDIKDSQPYCNGIVDKADKFQVGLENKLMELN